MEVEETLPKRSSFGRVVAITGVALLFFFLIGWLLLRRGHAVPGRYTKTPTSQLVQPAKSNGMQATPVSA